MAGEIIKAYFGIIAIMIALALFTPILIAVVTGFYEWFVSLGKYFGESRQTYRKIIIIFTLIFGAFIVFLYDSWIDERTRQGIVEVEEVGYEFDRDRCLRLEKPAHGNYCQDAVDYLKKQGRYDEVKSLELGFYRQKCLRFELDCDKARELLNQQ